MARATDSHRFDKFVHPERHPVWSGAFDPVVRAQQLDEDLFASRSVSGVLIAIVTGGMLLGVLGVLLCAWFA